MHNSADFLAGVIEGFHRARERRPAARFLFCPTPYCGWMTDRQRLKAGPAWRTG